MKVHRSLDQVSSRLRSQTGPLQPDFSLTTLTSIFGTVLILVFARYLTTKRTKVPIIYADKIWTATRRAAEYGRIPRKLMWDGYTQFKDCVWGISTNDGTKLVLPEKFLDELKSHPSLSFKASIDNDMLTEFTLFGGPPEYVINTVKSKLTPTLGSYTPVLHGLVQETIHKTFDEYKDWTPIKIMPRVLRLVGTTSARVFHSSEVSQNDQWLEVSTGYVEAVFECIKALKKWPPFLRPFVFRLLPQRAAIKAQWKLARQHVARSMAKKKRRNGADLDTPPTMLDHLSSGKNAAIADDIEKQLLYQMTLVAVGTVTTFASIVQCFYDLAGYPEYIAELREEVIKLPRDENGHFTKDAISAMAKIDSFMKESQRLSSADLTTFQRATLADVTISDGTFIPKGTKLEIATCSIHEDEKYYTNARQFDGLRFYRERLQEGNESKHQYVSVSKRDLAFGYGRHACPGRFLSNIVIKLTLAELLLNYDIKCLPGQVRPKNVEFENMVDPDPEVEILFMSRK